MVHAFEIERVVCSVVEVLTPDDECYVGQCGADVGIEKQIAVLLCAVVFEPVYLAGVVGRQFGCETFEQAPVVDYDA